MIQDIPEIVLQNPENANVKKLSGERTIVRLALTATTIIRIVNSANVFRTEP